MKKTTLLILLAALAACAGAENETAANPVLQRFPDHILFFAGFDHGSVNAEMSTAGDGKPFKVDGKPVFEDGLYGKALAGGQLQFTAGKNLPIETTGSIVFWISPVDWQERDDEGYLMWFYLIGEGSMMIRRQGEIFSQAEKRIRRRASVFAFTMAKGLRGQSHKYDTGGWRQWKNGTWHLVVVNWTVGRMAISVDGCPPGNSHTPGQFGKAVRFVLDASAPAGFRCLLDDFIILNRPLTAEEIALIWQDTGKTEKTSVE